MVAEKASYQEHCTKSTQYVFNLYLLTTVGLYPQSALSFQNNLDLFPGKQNDGGNFHQYFFSLKKMPPLSEILWRQITSFLVKMFILMVIKLVLLPHMMNILTKLQVIGNNFYSHFTEHYFFKMAGGVD